VHHLLGAGESANSQDSEGWTALHWAFWNGQGDTVDEKTARLLLQCQDVALDLQDKRGMTALHWAAADGQEHIVKLLLDGDAQIDLLDRDGLTPLALAVENEHLGTVELLLEFGADVNAAAEVEDTAMSEDGG